MIIPNECGLLPPRHHDRPAPVHGHAGPGAVAQPRTAAAAAAACAGRGHLGASSQVQADEVRVSWRPSRHARRLLTLAAAALLLALLTRNPALAGVAGPPLLLLGMARRGAGRAGSGRPGPARQCASA